MRRLALALLISSFVAGGAFAQTCETKAVSQEGKPLSGATKMSFIKKCKTDACAGKAVSSEGKPTCQQQANVASVSASVSLIVPPAAVVAISAATDASLSIRV